MSRKNAFLLIAVLVVLFCFYLMASHTTINLHILPML